MSSLLIVYFALTFWEWVLHSQIMHGDPDTLRGVPVIGPFLAKVAADHIAHHVDVNIDMSLKGEAHDSGLFFSWQTTIAGALLMIGTLLLARVDTHKAIGMGIAASLLMSVLWNSLHAGMHGSELRVDASMGVPSMCGLSTGPIYDALWTYHAVHHSQKGRKFNFNILFPGFDFIAGTYKHGCFDNTVYCAANGHDDRCAHVQQGCFTNDDVRHAPK